MCSRLLIGVVVLLAFARTAEAQHAVQVTARIEEPLMASPGPVEVTAADGMIRVGEPTRGESSLLLEQSYIQRGAHAPAMRTYWLREGDVVRLEQRTGTADREPMIELRTNAVDVTADGARAVTVTKVIAINA